MTRILNAAVLTSHGNIAGRRAVVEILEAGLQAADPYHNTLSLLHLDGETLRVGDVACQPIGDPKFGQDEVIDLRAIDRIFVFGAGKGAQRVAKAIEDVLGERVTGGAIIAKHDDPLELGRIEVWYGAHPVPDAGCVRGCERILELTSDLTERDLVFTVAGNGVSSLLTRPVPGVTLEDVQQLTRLMQIERGVPTIDLNPVRNNIDALKGGKISRRLRMTRAIHLVMADPCGQMTASSRSPYEDLMTKNVWLHFLPDGTSFEEAISILKKWECWDRTPESIRSFLLKADPAWETVRAAEFESWGHRIFGVMPAPLGMLPTAERKAAELGFTPHRLTSEIVAEARVIGTAWASIAMSCVAEGKPFAPPCAIFSSGELVVTVGQANGVGGRNQEFALSAALAIAGTSRIVIGAVDSDGTDGPGAQFAGSKDIPTLAGAVVDGETVAEAASAGIDPRAELRRHNTTPPLWALDSGVVATHGVSMNDLDVILILPES
jgi:glycerate 2-kinase